MEEVWKSAPSYPGVMASSWGRIKNPVRIGVMPMGGTREYVGKPTYGTKRHPGKKWGNYHYFAARVLGKQNVKVHRVVCDAFHGPAPFAGAVVMHLDDNPLNNRPENLRWASQRENLNSPTFRAYCATRVGQNSPRAKARF